MPHHETPLKFLFRGWYAIVMGLTGLALAWYRAVPLMGEAAAGTSLAIGLLALLVFVALAVATVMRALRHADAWAEDRRHPVRHTFVATLPVAVILLATTMVAHELRGPLPEALWALGAAAQLAVTAWVLARWWKGNGPQGLAWASATPALFIPIVGNVLVPLAGVPLGHAEWSAAQFGVGLMFWPVVTVLIGVRIAQQGLWPSHSKLGERSYWVKRINVRVNTGANQSVISGRKIQTLNSLEGYGLQQLTWLIMGSGKLTIEAGSPTTGSKTIDVSL